MLEKRVKWHDANITAFVKTWQDYVAPTGVGAAAGPGAGQASTSGVDNNLPD